MKSKHETLAGHMDDLIRKGGSWKALEIEGNKHSICLGFKTRCTPRIYKAHITYRQIKDDNYLGNRKVTDEGIF